MGVYLLTHPSKDKPASLGLLMLAADVGDRYHADGPEVEGDQGSHRVEAAAFRLFALGDRAVPVRVEDTALA